MRGYTKQWLLIQAWHGSFGSAAWVLLMESVSDPMLPLVRATGSRTV